MAATLYTSAGASPQPRRHVQGHPKVCGSGVKQRIAPQMSAADVRQPVPLWVHVRLFMLDALRTPCPSHTQSDDSASCPTEHVQHLLRLLNLAMGAPSGDVERRLLLRRILRVMATPAPQQMHCGRHYGEGRTMETQLALSKAPTEGALAERLRRERPLPGHSPPRASSWGNLCEPLIHGRASELECGAPRALSPLFAPRRDGVQALQPALLMRELCVCARHVCVCVDLDAPCAPGGCCKCSGHGEPERGCRRR